MSILSRKWLLSAAFAASAALSGCFSLAPMATTISRQEKYAKELAGNNPQSQELIPLFETMKPEVLMHLKHDHIGVIKDTSMGKFKFAYAKTKLFKNNPEPLRGMTLDAVLYRGTDSALIITRGAPAGIGDAIEDLLEIAQRKERRYVMMVWGAVGISGDKTYYSYKIISPSELNANDFGAVKRWMKPPKPAAQAPKAG